jgi:hypothetical protein
MAVKEMMKHTTSFIHAVNTKENKLFMK